MSDGRSTTRREPAPEIVFAGTDGGALTELADYEAVGGLRRSGARAR